MRPLTYILAVVAGVFVLGGIGLIIKGYQLEGAIALIIGVLDLVQFIRFFKEDYLMKKNQNYVWYAGYGSNLSEQRFLCYIQGGVPKYGKRNERPCNDVTPPIDNQPFTIPYRLYFALSDKKTKTKNWDKGGVSYITPNPEKNEDNWTLGRIWKITKEQYEEIKEKEGISYDHEILLDNKNDIPIYTITNENRLTNILKPSESYLKTIIEGLKETNELSDESIGSYLLKKEGITNNYTRNQLLKIIESVK